MYFFYWYLELSFTCLERKAKTKLLEMGCTSFVMSKYLFVSNNNDYPYLSKLNFKLLLNTTLKLKVKKNITPFYTNFS